MSYVPAKLREIFQTCRLRPENIADWGAFGSATENRGIRSVPAGRSEAPETRTAAGRFAGGGPPFRPVSAASPFRGKFRSHFLFGERAGEDRGAGMQGVRRPPRWTITMDRGLFSIEKSSGAKPIRSPAGASAAYVRERRKSQGLRGSRPRRFSREAGGSSNAASPRRFREVPAARQGKDAGVFPRFRLIGKGRAGAVRRVADDADGSFTNGSNRESPATGPASGRGTGWG